MADIRPFAGHSPRIDPSAYIDATATLIGDVEIGAQSSIWPQVVVRGDIHRIRIGARTNIQDASVCHVTHASDYNPDGFALSLGDGISVGHRCVLHGCSIGDYCLIGMGAVIMDGVEIGDHCIIGAGALVPPGKQLPPGTLWVGSPAQQTRLLKDSEHQYLEYQAQRYVELAQRYREASA